MDIIHNNIDNCINNIVNNVNILNSIGNYNVLKCNFAKLLEIDKLIAEIVNDNYNNKY